MLADPCTACIGDCTSVVNGCIALDSPCCNGWVSEPTCPVASAGALTVCVACPEARIASLIPVCAAACATASPAATGAAGDAPIGATGGGTANAAIRVLSAPEYAHPTLELCGQCSPKYSLSSATISGVRIPKKFVALAVAHSSRLA